MTHNSSYIVGSAQWDVKEDVSNIVLEIFWTNKWRIKLGLIL